jgi:KinB signaling pathway activation protein
MFTLLVCNAYQILILHKLNTKSDQERQKRASQSMPKATKNKNKKINTKPSM